MRRATALVLPWVIPAAVSAQQSAAAPALVFDGVTVVDVEQGKLVPDQRVIIVGNRIQTMGSTGAVKMPNGAQAVDARGKYLIPGLWDLHTHRGYTPEREAAVIDYIIPLANGVTGIRDAYSNYVPLDSQVVWWREILAGTRVGPPRQLLAGSVINQLSEAEIADLKARGANFLKLYPFEPEIAAAARRSGLMYGGHVHGGSAIEASDSGMVILDHLNTAGDLAERCLGPQASIELCQPVAERFKVNNSWFAPTLITFAAIGGNWTEGIPGADDVASRLHDLSRRFWADSIGHGNWLRATASATSPTGSTTDSTSYFHILRKVGMPILAATDADGTKGQLVSKLKGFALHAELAIFVLAGSTPLEALQAATINPAKMLRGTDSLGTVAPGKLADLVLLDADPLADITNTTMIRAVVANGRYFDRAALDSLLAEVRVARAKEVQSEEEGP